MHPHAGHTNVRRDREEGQPQVLDLSVGEHLLYQGVEPEARQHAVM